jgi:hypothetical protein
MLASKPKWALSDEKVRTNCVLTVLRLSLEEVGKSQHRGKRHSLVSTNKPEVGRKGGRYYVSNELPCAAVSSCQEQIARVKYNRGRITLQHRLSPSQRHFKDSFHNGSLRTSHRDRHCERGDSGLRSLRYQSRWYSDNPFIA